MCRFYFSFVCNNTINDDGLWNPFNELCSSRLMEQSSPFQIDISSLVLQMVRLFIQHWPVFFVFFFQTLKIRVSLWTPRSTAFIFSRNRILMEWQQVNALSQLLGAVKGFPPNCTHTWESTRNYFICVRLLSLSLHTHYVTELVSTFAVIKHFFSLSLSLSLYKQTWTSSDLLLPFCPPISLHLI